jgi:KDEL-tailed cysteine endopeptidase
MFTILGTWTSQAMSRTLQEASMEERHEQWMSQYDRKYSDDAEKARKAVSRYSKKMQNL